MQDLREADFTQDVLLKLHSGAEAVEGVVHSNPFTSEFIGKPVVDLPMPQEANIGAIVRNEKIYMPSDDLLLSIDDHLIVFFTDKQAIPEIENYFREV
jgi:trk system potassium uptake protein TrkA